MKRRIFSIFFALVLVLSMSLVMAVPVAAAIPTLQVDSFTLEIGSYSGTPASTAEWSIVQKHSGSYAVRLASGIEAGQGDEARIVIPMPAGTTLGDIESIAWWVYAVAGYPPHVDIYLDVDEDGVVDPEDVLTAEMWYNNTEAVGVPPVTPGEPGTWIPANVSYETWLQTFELVSDDGFGAVDDTSLLWLCALGGGPGDAPWATLAQWKAGEVGGDPGSQITPGIIDGTAPVLRLEIEVDNWVVDSEAYVDDVTINGVTYDLEPSFLDADWYKTGDPVGISVQDLNFNLDLVRADEMTVHAVSNTDTSGIDVVLEETDDNSSVFTGSFPTTGISPGADELKVSDEDTITVTYYYLDTTGEPITENPISDTATVDDTPPTIDNLSPVDGTIEYDATPTISASLSDGTGSQVDPETGYMTVNGAVVPATFTTSNVTYTIPDPGLDPGTIVMVTIDVMDNVGNAVMPAAWTFTIADDFNVSLDVDEIAAAPATPTPVIARFTDVGDLGPGDILTLLETVKVSLSGVGVDLESGDFDGNEGTRGDATGHAATTLTFSVTPEQAGTITVTFVGTFTDTNVEPVTKTLDISVTGFVVEETWADVGMETTGAISMRVTTEAGVAVNTGIVTITALEADGFEKDVDPLGEGDESFKTIVIDGGTGEITYDDTNASTEDFLVSDGYYEVTGITFANIGDVDILVEDAGGDGKAHFLTAFTVLGIAVYDLSFEPATLTAGVDLVELAITVTEADEPVTDVDSITIDGEVISIDSAVDNVYIVDPELVSEVATLSVSVRNAALTQYGTADLEVALPTVIPDTELMLTSVDYTVGVSVIDALGEALEGNLWIGTYDEATEIFTADSEVHPADAPLELDAEGMGEFVDIIVEAEAFLVWKVGSGAGIDDAALILTPSIAVEDLYYDLNPTEAAVGVDTTYTVTDNYGAVAGNLDVEIVTPSGNVIPKVTTPLGIFKYIAPGAGDYYVSIMVAFDTWQDPITVTVSGVATIDLYEGANPIHYTGATTDLPGALTNIVDLTEVIWQRDASTGGEWWYYLVPLDHGQITQLENGRVYIVVVSQACTWELPQ